MRCVKSVANARAIAQVERATHLKVASPNARRRPAGELDGVEAWLSRVSGEQPTEMGGTGRLRPTRWSVGSIDVGLVVSD